MRMTMFVRVHSLLMSTEEIGNGRKEEYSHI